MMKKLLVLALILGIASMSQAMLTKVSVDGSEVADITTPILVAPGAAVTVTLATEQGDAGGLSFPFNMSGENTSNWSASNVGGAFLIPAMWTVNDNGVSSSGGSFTFFYVGDVVEIGFNVDGNTTVSTTGNAAGQDIPTLAFIVPEPATLALLGLGALVLRRKK